MRIAKMRAVSVPYAPSNRLGNMKNKTRNQTKKSAARDANKRGVNPQSTASTEVDSAVVFREGFESMVVAILLALLFRGFEAEAFIIPTGSMAPTLQGKHKDLRCPECDFRYRSNQPATSPVHSTTCPMCRYELQRQRHSGAKDPLEVTYNGDRIIVNKFAYQIGDPQRWDVIVFKFPGNAKQNYIKRLVGLPGETLQISGGDVFATRPDEDEFTILRKPVEKIPYMLHLVHDTRYIPQTLIDADWPARWHVPEGNAGASSWEISADRREHVLQPHDEIGWLKYRHLPLQAGEWDHIRRPSLRNGRGNFDFQGIAPQVPGRLITDWYAYNAYNRGESGNGLHWVGDLALEAAVDITTESGELWLDLIEGGDHYRCKIDVSTGVANVELPDGTELTANTPVRGKGSHRIRWANLDDQVLLWVGGKPVVWQSNGAPHPGHYVGERLVKPKWSDGDSGDLLPAGIGGRNIGLKATKLKVFRDIYYTTVKQTPNDPSETTDYVHIAREIVRRTLISPPVDSSEADAIFSDRRKLVEFQLGENQYFPMGDNSPASKDARLWAINDSQVTESGRKYIDNFVERDLLIGKAILVYWPHGWPLGPISGAINPVPNVDRMGKIR